MFDPREYGWCMCAECREIRKQQRESDFIQTLVTAVCIAVLLYGLLTAAL